MAASQRYFGKYRGTVFNNVDPMQIGRVQVSVPDVTGLTPSSWAMPCVPFAGKQSGMFVVPQVGAGVWVEFEGGDSSYPIWVGGFWGSVAEMPVMAIASVPASPSIVLQTGGGNMLVISDLPGPTGGLMLKTAGGAMLQISDVGITLSNSQASITMTGPTIALNGEALTVT